MGAIGKIGYVLAKNAPKILFWGGLAMNTAGTVWACYSSVKIKDDVRNFKQQLDDIQYMEDQGDILPEEAKKERYAAKRQIAWTFVKRYGPPLVLLGAGTTGVISAHGLLSKRLAGTAAALSSTAAAFEAYRERVRLRLGDDFDKEIMLGTQTKTFIEQKVDEDGVISEVETTAPVALVTGEFTKFFDPEHSEYARGIIDVDMAFLSLRQHYFNQRLHSKWFITEAEMNEELGYTEAKDPRNTDPDTLIRGWRYVKDNPKGDNFVDLGAEVIYIEDPETHTIKKTIVINPNFDGDIYNSGKKGH